MTPLAPSFQLPFSLSPPVGGDPSETQTQGDLGGQGLRHGPSAAPQAAEAVREGSRSSGSHSRLARRCGAAHPASSSTTGGGGVRRHPRGREPLSGRAPALSGPLASKFKLPAAGGSRGPGPPPRPQRGTASRRGGQGGLPVLRVTLAPRAPVRRRSPRVLLHDRRGGVRRRPRGREPLSGHAPSSHRASRRLSARGSQLRRGPQAHFRSAGCILQRPPS
ncbi:hypothetical protein NDU88_001305 [Pleurodeles waltl]|uniref:Uncharacterized protein n=1 Tax=Pleurodeles waltl TaxID=8319 RepID=A0AAV7R8M5_PLEWA|nr:hypothetical protein NDU88_001305 [Pleurodeles waltl]